MAKNNNKRYLIKELDLREISAVDFPAQVHARATIVKRGEGENMEPYWKRDFTQAQRDAAAESGAAMSDGSFPIKNWSDLENAVRAVGRASNPDAARKHIISRARSLGATDLLPESWNVGKAAMPKGIKACPTCDGAGEVESANGEDMKDCPDCGGSGMVKKSVSAKEKNMSDEVEKITILEAQVTDLTKKLTAAEQTVQKKDAEIAEVKKAKEAAETDEVIKIGDAEVRKSKVGADTFAVMKAQQAQITAEVEKRELVELEKRAEKEYPSLPGEPVAKAKVLKAINAIGEETRKVLETMLKAGETAMKSRLRVVGGESDPNTAGDSPVARMEAMAKTYSETNKVSVAKAHEALSRNKEYNALYAEAHGNKNRAA